MFALLTAQLLGGRPSLYEWPGVSHSHAPLVRSTMMAPTSLSRRSLCAVVWLVGAEQACAGPSLQTIMPGGKPARVYDVMTSVAGPGGPGLSPAEGQLGRLAAALAQLDLLVSDLQKTLHDQSYKTTDEDSIVVLRLSAIYWKSTPELMRLTAELMSQLGSEDLATAATIADEFEVTIKELEQACRAKDLPSQLQRAKVGSAQLTRYLAVASHNYKVPTVQQPYSSFRPPS
jgi:hypothetical protein